MNPIFAESKINQWLRVSTFSRDAVFAVAAVVMVLLANSCSTTRGFGQDVEKTGDKIQEAAAR